MQQPVPVFGKRIPFDTEDLRGLRHVLDLYIGHLLGKKPANLSIREAKGKPTMYAAPYKVAGTNVWMVYVIRRRDDKLLFYRGPLQDEGSERFQLIGELKIPEKIDSQHVITEIESFRQKLKEKLPSPTPGRSVVYGKFPTTELTEYQPIAAPRQELQSAAAATALSRIDWDI